MVNICTCLPQLVPTPAIQTASDISMQSVSISWTSELPQDTDLEYSLSVISSNTQLQILHTRESSIEFSAPGYAPPCEIYNFSVTATYVGATYTGSTCSVPSQVLSRMLPSLPDIENVVPSLEKTIEGVILKISFEVLPE